MVGVYLPVVVMVLVVEAIAKAMVWMDDMMGVMAEVCGCRD